MIEKYEWRIGEEGAAEVCLKNARLMDIVFESLVKHCGNPYCDWMVSAIRSANFSIPEYGDVCATCHDLYTNLSFMNLHLRNGKYFQKLHEDWLKNQNSKNDKQRRDKLGL